MLVAKTNRSWAWWQGAIAIVIAIALAFVGGGRRQIYDPAANLAIIIFVIAAGTTAWYRATHLSERHRQSALALRDLLIARLPNATLVQPPN